MAEALSTLRIVVEASAETNDHEVRLLDGDDDIIHRFDRSMMGLDPDEILISPCPLHSANAPHRVTIARCGCGVTGCGSIEVLVQRNADVVTWCDVHSPVTVRFHADAYEAEVLRALSDFSWETPERTAARLISSSIDRPSLALSGFEYRWSSGRILSKRMSVALWLVPGPYQVLVHVEDDGLSPEQCAQRCLNALAGAPTAWTHVTWYPQAPGLGAPSMAGPGWRKGDA